VSASAKAKAQKRVAAVRCAPANPNSLHETAPPFRSPKQTLRHLWACVFVAAQMEGLLGRSEILQPPLSWRTPPEGGRGRALNDPRAIQIVWFKRDLRLRDHAPLLAAALHGPVLPLYIIEPSVWQAADADALHWSFVRESLLELQDELAQRGAELYVRQGEAVEVLEQLRHTLLVGDADSVSLWSHMETGNAITYARDLAVGAWARAAKVRWAETPQQGVVRRLKNRDDWQAGWRAHMDVPALPAPRHLKHTVRLDGVAAPAIIPNAAELGIRRDAPAARPELAVGRFESVPQRGGERAAQALLEDFLDHRGARYHRELSSPLTALRSCSRLSAHLAWGCLSIREVVQRTAAVKAERKTERPAAVPARALNAFASRLHWHCHFIQKLESEPEIEFRCFHPGCEGLRGDPAKPHAEFLARWKNATTGYPFIDACMRALQTWGWINFRMRAMLVSFAAYHLWLDWRSIHPFLARQFRDYEPGIHLSQLQMQSGVTGINTLRIYNPIKQSQDHDPDGVFIRHWLPELAPISDTWIHTPWLDPRGLPDGYPPPIVDHATAVRAARNAFSALRGSDGFREQSQRVYEAHGSRSRRGKRRAARAPARSKSKGGGEQLELPM